MPSRTEGFGLTALVALSAGLPILVSGNSGFGNTLCTLPLGKPFVVDSADPKDWAKAIRAVRLKDRTERLQEVQRLRTSYEKKFSWKKQCEALVEKMRSLVYDLPRQMFVNLRQMQRDVSKVSSDTDLLAELEKIVSDKGFVISDNEGSGNCMFYALSEQLNFVKGIKISHGELRQSIVEYLRKYSKLPDGTDLFNFIDGYQSWADYLSSMEQDGTWGDHVILYGTANRYETCIDVISSQSNHSDLTIRPDGPVGSTNPLVLGHVREVHYVSLQPKQGPAMTRKRETPGSSVKHPRPTHAVKGGSPENNDLERLANQIINEWKKLGRRLLESDEALLDAVDEDNGKCSEKAYKMLLKWKASKGSNATFRVLHDALCHDLVNRRDLAEKLCLVTND